MSARRGASHLKRGRSAGVVARSVMVLAVAEATVAIAPVPSE
jgi:hypothetical protein